MANKTKFGFGSSDNLAQVLSEGKINARDVVFLDENTDNPKIGWVTKDGKVVIAETDLSDIEADISVLETAMATKASTEEVDAKIATALDAIELDAKADIEYEISYKPNGTIVDYRDKEIRVMCPANTEWEFQNSGEGSDANCYYIGFKAYAPSSAVSFKEDLNMTIIDDTMYYFENNDFAGIDNGRKYSIVWLPVAKYDGSTWNYYGANSVANKYIGWFYSVEWYDGNGVLIASDCIKINLSNEQCHSSIEPYYMGEIMKEFDVKIEERIAEVESAYEIIEF